MHLLRFLFQAKAEPGVEGHGLEQCRPIFPRPVAKLFLCETLRFNQVVTRGIADLIAICLGTLSAHLRTGKALLSLCTNAIDACLNE